MFLSTAPFGVSLCLLRLGLPRSPPQGLKPPGVGSLTDHPPAGAGRVPVFAASEPTTVAAYPGDFGAFNTRCP
eukprot:7055301-Pyramimonas_sp.AAC.1